MDIASRSDEPVVGETLTPSSALKRGKRKLENILDQSFSHKTWKYGRIVQPNQPDSDNDDDPNVPFYWKSLSHSERNNRQDLHLNNNPILDAEPAQRDRLQDLVANYSEIWTDGLSYNAGSMASVPFISARVILDPPKGPHSPHRAAVRVLNPVQRAGLENKIKIWLEQDIIEESASPWSWPMISVAKKRRAGQTIPEYRFCADLRVLNNKVLTDNLFTGSVPANLALLERHNIYSNLDM